MRGIGMCLIDIILIAKIKYADSHNFDKGDLL